VIGGASDERLGYFGPCEELRTPPASHRTTAYQASIGIKILVTPYLQSALFLSNIPVIPAASLSVSVRECDICRRSGGDHDHYFYDSCVGDVVIVSVVL
jgi:hypothetical protein